MGARPVLTLFLLVLATPVGAQAVGDSIRIELRPESPWISGRYLGQTSDRVRIRQFPNDTGYRRADVLRLDRWQHRGAGGVIATNILMGAAVWGLGNQLVPEESRWRTGQAMYAGAILGAIVGVIDYAITPGKWHKVKLLP